MKKFIFLIQIFMLAFFSMNAQDTYFRQFNGTDQSMYVKDNSNNDLDISNNWTIEAWVKVNSYSDNDWSVIMDRRTVFSLYLINDDDADFAVRFVARDGSDNIIASLRSDNSTINLSLNQWFHVAVCYDGTTARMFINGTEVDNDNSDPDFSLTASSKALNIGARYWDSYQRYLNGSVDQIHISKLARYNSNFTPDFYTLPTSDDNSVLLLNFEQNAADAANNFSSSEIVDHNSAVYVSKVSISPTAVQDILVNQDGNTLTVSDETTADSHEWKYSTTSGSGYQSFSPAETGDSYTPNFSSAGTYYVVCQSTHGSSVLTSNEVEINVTENTSTISPTDVQYLLTGSDGGELTVTETPSSADSREWKYSTTSGGPYQSFSPVQTATTFTPNFSERGIYYVVCESTFGSDVKVSNEVKIIVDTSSSDSYLSFDGDDSFYLKDENQDYINVTDNWTFETWVKVKERTDGTYPVIMDREKCFSMYVQGDGSGSDDFSIAFVKRDGNDAIVASLSSADKSEVEFKFGLWYHVAAQYDGTTAKLFINGIEVDNSTDDFTLRIPSTDYINFGARYRSGYERYLSGSLENIRISDVARYTSNFTPDFYSPMQGDANTVVCLNLEDAPGSSLFDFSGHFDISLRDSPNNPDWMDKAVVNISPTDVQDIIVNQDGTTLTAIENGIATSREWKYSTTSGGGYQSFSPAQTEQSYTPNFSAAGTYYVVCISDFNGTLDTSNEVQINVSEAASITTETINGSPFYVSADSSASVSVPYTVTGTFASNNVFTAYLSDNTGNFSNETPIGTLASTTDGTIYAEIPAGIPAGQHYRIRVNSSNPQVLGADNGNDLEIIYLWDTITPIDEQIIDINENGITLIVSEQPFSADSREWKYSTVSGGPYQSFSSPQTGISYTPNFSQPGTYYVVCQSVFNSANIITTSNEVKIIVETPFKILFINDDDNGDEAAPIDTALAHTGFTYYKVNTTDSIPSYSYLRKFNFILWYTGNDGITNLWDEDSTYIDQLEQYVESGGKLWVDGLDFIYDIYGTAPDDFSSGDFLYDKLGISHYLSQSYADDGNVGVSQFDILPQNTITSENPIKWQYSSLWYADGLAITDKAVPLYAFGGDDYSLAGQISALYTQVNYGTYITSGFRLAKLGNANAFVQDSLDKLISEIILYTQQTPAVHCGDIHPTIYTITSNSGEVVKIPFSIEGGFGFNSNNEFSAYLSNADGDFSNETLIGSLHYIAGDTIVAMIPPGTPSGEHYRIRIKASNPTLVSEDNGVDITIVLASVSISPADTQTIYIGQDGITLTAIESTNADSREWKYSTTSGGPYQSFSPAEIKQTYIPNFDMSGTYYVVCQSRFGNYTAISNEVVINVLNSEIHTGKITGGPLIISDTQGVSVNVPYSVIGYFASDNIFTAYLSDSLGNFDNEIPIGYLPSTTNGVISAEIPAGTPSGNYYRIRVKSSDPIVIGSDNGEDIVVEYKTTAISGIDGVSIKLYPNPVSDILYFSYEQAQTIKVQIMDNTGRILISKYLRDNFLNISYLTSGIYTVRIMKNDSVMNFKIIKL